MKKNKMNEIKRECQKFLGLSAVWMSAMAFTQLSFAQSNVVADEGSGNSGGGNITEVDLRYYMGKIDTYLLSEEGRKAFPEIVAFDEAHPTEKFHDLILNTKPVVQKGELRDANGVVRDCMSYANPGNRYFVCNSDALPNKTLENQPSFYRIVLHELLVQAGIEKPVSKEIPSVYSVSSRITDNVHLETYQEWVPGKGSYKDQTLVDSGIFCRTDTTRHMTGKNLMFILRPNGDYALLEVALPKIQNHHGRMQEQVITKFQETLYQIKLKTLDMITQDVVSTVLLKGNSKELFQDKSSNNEAPASMYYFLESPWTQLNMYSNSALAKVKRSSGSGYYSEVPMHVQFQHTEIQSRKTKYINETLICTGAGEYEYMDYIGNVDEFFKSDSKVVKKDWIKENYNRMFKD
jgi:hypothetical protein